MGLTETKGFSPHGDPSPGAAPLKTARLVRRAGAAMGEVTRRCASDAALTPRCRALPGTG